MHVNAHTVLCEHVHVHTHNYTQYKHKNKNFIQCTNMKGGKFFRVNYRQDDNEHLLMP